MKLRDRCSLSMGEQIKGVVLLRLIQARGRDSGWKKVTRVFETAGFP